MLVDFISFVSLLSLSFVIFAAVLSTNNEEAKHHTTFPLPICYDEHDSTRGDTWQQCTGSLSFGKG
jgi:hypothetical protein